MSPATGFKNSLKGVGYFLGAATVGVSYNGALGILLGLIGLAMPGAMFLLSKDLGKSTGKKKVTLHDVFRMNYNINVLSAARLFLFGSRCAAADFTPPAQPCLPLDSSPVHMLEPALAQQASLPPRRRLGEHNVGAHEAHRNAAWSGLSAAAPSHARRPHRTSHTSRVHPCSHACSPTRLQFISAQTCSC